MANFVNEDTDYTLRSITSTRVGKVWRPITAGGLSSGANANQTQKNLVQKAVVTTTGAATPAGGPLQVLSVSVVESPSKQQDRTYSEVSVSFAKDPADSNFASVKIWFIGYQGNPSPTLMTEGATSPVTFLVESTGETVSVKVQAASSTGLTTDLTSAPTAPVTLDGVVSAPPAPTVTQTLLATPVGYQFQFAYEGGLLADVISGYNVYRNTTNSPSGATIVKNVPQPSTNTGTYTYQESVAPGINYFYWVTSVNTVGLESAKTNAQSGLIVGGYFASTPITANNGFTYTSNTNSINLIWTSQAVYRANGLTALIGSGSQNVTGLAASTTYYVFPFFDEGTQALGFISNSNVTFPNFSGVTFTVASSQEITTTTAAALGTIFSVEFMVKTAAGYAGGGGLCKALAQTGTISSVNSVYTIGLDGAGHITCSFRDTGGTLQTLTSAIKVNDGNYHHIVHSVTGSSVHNLYIDGVQAATASLSTSPSATATDFWRVAKDSNNVLFGGTLTEVAIYGAALTALQVSSHYNANTLSQAQYEAAVSQDAPTIWWKLTDASQTFADSGSITGNTGHGVNTPALQQSSPIFSGIGSPAIVWTARNLLVSQAQFTSSRVPLTSGGLAVATVAAGTGSGGTGGSTGGSGSGCFSGNTRIQTPNGSCAIEDLKPGDFIVSKNQVRQVLTVVKHAAELRKMLNMECNELVTVNHLMFSDGWKPAQEVFSGSDIVEYGGPVYNLLIDAADYDDKSYWLSNGVLAHNGKLL
jgi:hypothetical protein